MSYSKTIYKLDSDKRLRYLTVKALGDEVIQESGLTEGSPIIHSSKCEGKNLGRSNKTTPEQQALAEAEALIIKKLKKDYFETIEEAKSNIIELPMLAQRYEDCKDKIEFPCWVQPKLDGMRSNVNQVKFISRENRPITWMNHIWGDIKKCPFADTFDGELYAHGYSFEDNMRMTKKYREGITELVSLNVYDLCLPNLSFVQRYAVLKQMVEIINSPHIHLVPTYSVKDMEDVKKYHAQFLNEGYEGTIIRWGNAGYKFNGRSENLVKYKDFKDIALTILDVIPMDKYPKQGMIICEMNGERFTATPKMSHDKREELLLNKANYIGETAEIRYFQETDRGVARFPVFVGIRNDK